jgi:hypothetical protein
MSLPPGRPNFLIIGAAKAATTTLSNLLDRHPQAAIVQGKEPHFFSVDANYQAGWERYQRLFSHCTHELATGDASTSYSRIRYHPDTVRRILHHVPEVKIIYMVRHPLRRMESAYVERLATRVASQFFGSINDAVRQQPMIVDSSRYWEVFDHYRAHFGASRILVVWFEEFVADLDAGFRKVCDFLDIDPAADVGIGHELQNRREHATRRMQQLGRGHLGIDTEWDAATRRWVIEQIREDNVRLLEHFHKPRNYWGDIFD